MATTQGIKLDDTTADRLKAMAEQKGRSPHWLMKTAIEEYLVHEEQYESEKSEDMARWERYALTGKANDSDRVDDWLQKLANGNVEPWRK